MSTLLPIDSLDVPRFVGVANFMRLPTPATLNGAGTVTIAAGSEICGIRPHHPLVVGLGHLELPQPEVPRQLHRMRWLFVGFSDGIGRVCPHHKPTGPDPDKSHADGIGDHLHIGKRLLSRSRP